MRTFIDCPWRGLKKMSYFMSLVTIGGVLFYALFYIFVGDKDEVCLKQTDPQVVLDNQISASKIEQINRKLNMKVLGSILNIINIIRPVGSNNHSRVREYIKSFLLNEHWDVYEDKFEESTIIGKMIFSNIIGTSNPFAPRRIVLACHYDSKLIKGFYGTTDSAVPCAIILNIVKSLQKEILSTQLNVALQVIFFDGEEAFGEWTDTDSIYGSRHLAARMKNNSINCNDLSKIDLFVLLDLFGAAGITIPRYPHCDQRFYEMLRSIESLAKDTIKSSQTKTHKWASSGSYFSSRTYSGVGDDHLPFLKEKVPVLHLIPIPFPKQWHTVDDNIDNVDMNTVHNLQLVIASFVSQYLQLIHV